MKNLHFYVRYKSAADTDSAVTRAIRGHLDRGLDAQMDSRVPTHRKRNNARERNNSPELLSLLLQQIYHKNGPQMVEEILIMFAVFFLYRSRFWVYL